MCRAAATAGAPPHGVEDDIEAGAGDLAQRCVPGAVGHRDDLVGPRAQASERRGVPRGGHHAGCAQEPGDLDGEEADGPGGPDHQDGLAGLEAGDVAQRDRGGDADQTQSGCRREVQVLGQRHERIGGDGDALGSRPVERRSNDSVAASRK